MKSTLKRLGVVAALGTMGALAPVASASAATTPVLPTAFALPGSSLPAFDAATLPAFTPPALPPLSFVGPATGGLATVIGPTVITTAPSTFINTNIQTSAGSNLSGGQAG
jgi:hypothetical protein